METTLHRRHSDGWIEVGIDDHAEMIVLPELGGICTLAEAYRGVRFPSP